MNNLKLTVNYLTGFVVRHRATVAVAVTAITCVTMAKKELAVHDNFLKEHGLFDEFHANI